MEGEIAATADDCRPKGGSDNAKEGRKKALSDMNADQALRRWQRMCAHMICESLGYFTPGSAALALLHLKRSEPFYCEWYSHMAQFRNERRDLFDRESVLSVTRDIPREAYRNRRRHRGCMAGYERGMAAVRSELAGKGPVLASWF